MNGYYVYFVTRFDSKLVRLKVKEGIIVSESTFRFRFQTGSIKSTPEDVTAAYQALFRFQTGSIKRDTVRVGIGDTRRFRFQTGSIKRRLILPNTSTQFEGFDSKLVRLKGSVKAIIRLYAILMRRVKSIFWNVIFQVNLLSTCSSANSLGG